MTATIAAGSNYSHQTKTVAFAMMQDLDALMQSVGLTQASFTGAFDPGGSSSQMVDTLGTPSPWAAYDFTDSDQSTYPITVWLTLTYQRSGNAASPLAYGNGVYLPTFRISEGVDGSGNPLGRVVTNIPIDVAGSLTNTSNVDECYRLRATKGNFCRYSGDALTLIFGANGMNYPSGGPSSSGNIGGPWSAFELHIERRRDATDGSVQSGYVGLVQPGRGQRAASFAPFFPASYADSSIQNTPLMFARLDASPNYVEVGAQMRSGGPYTLDEVGTPITAPIFYRDENGRVNSLKRMFTIPVVSGASEGALYSLDFTGTVSPYLYHTFPGSYVTAGNIMHGQPALAALFEWE